MRRGWAIGAALFVLGSPAAAEDGRVYRWTDRDGRVNYGSTPPPGAKATVLQGSGRVSVVPAIVVPPVPAAAAPSETERLERLEHALEEERMQRRVQEEEALEREARRAQLRADCEKKYREPCDAWGQPAGPRYIVVPARPQHRLPGGRDDRGWEHKKPRPPVGNERPRSPERKGQAQAGADNASPPRPSEPAARPGDR